MQPSDDWREFVDEGWRRARLQTKFEREEQCASVMRARREEPASVSEALQALMTDTGEESTTLLRWIALFQLDWVPADMRSAVLGVLGTRDPPTAALICSVRPELPESERAVLRTCFYSTMPVARAKDMTRRG